MPDNDDIIYQQYVEDGYVIFDYDESVLQWIKASLKTAQAAVRHPKNQGWYRYQNTWFVGVNVLPNDTSGKVAGGVRLRGKAMDFIQHLCQTEIELDQGQLSVCYPGYPQPSNQESDAAYRYRLSRDAAHVDGIMREAEQRYLVEYHDYILALPMVEFSFDAAPFVAWQGSHKIMQSMLAKSLEHVSPENWRTTPVSEVYTAARKAIFCRCDRVAFALKPGQALLGHRHLLHGTAPWHAGATAGADGRMMCFFRPATLSLEQWLLAT